ncbi:MAG: Class SAM-dependent rRNA methyltransferase [Bacteroidota bacterium]|nr:Class SAM-dependent rRNA methyltransferase [Bacteroidota bacterium]
MLSLKLKPGSGRRIAHGHQWVFSNELQEIPVLPAGTIIELLNDRGKSSGLGFFNPSSLISIRMLYSSNLPDKIFFIDRLSKALKLRQTLYPNESIYRLCFGESDFLPGLIIDKYENWFSIQILSAGMELLTEIICEALLELFPDTKGIFAKNDSHLRGLEGLPIEEKILSGEIPENILTQEAGIKLSISLIGGQKTGYYLDQKDNRKLIRRLSSGRRVLDCFTNQGGFALNAAFGSAAYTLGVDSSADALNRAKSNAELNDFANIDFQKADVFDFLENEIKNQKKWDMIILDPPAFAKSKKSVPTAKKGYAKLNRLAISLLEHGGFLAASSCSQHIDEDIFYNLIIDEISKQRKTARLIFRGAQAADHPILIAMPETKYLKFFVFQII